MKFNEALTIVENSLTRYKKALFGEPSFAIISVDNPKGQPDTPKNNAKRRNDLKEFLASKGIKYSKQIGKYGTLEKSFMIYDISLDLAKKIADKNNQESFFYGVSENGKKVIEYYKTLVYEPANYKLIERKSDKVVLKDKATDFYSKKNGFKYSIDLDEFK